MNKVFIVGRLTADPNKSTTNTGSDICSFTLASDTFRKTESGDKITNFYRVSAFGKLASAISASTKKGHMLAVTGDIVFRPYVDKTGAQRLSIDVSANSVDFCTPKANGASGNNDEPAVDNGSDDDLPF